MSNSAVLPLIWWSLGPLGLPGTLNLMLALHDLLSSADSAIHFSVLRPGLIIIFPTGYYTDHHHCACEQWTIASGVNSGKRLVGTREQPVRCWDA